MLQRISHSNGVVTYRSELLSSAGVVHAFSTRIGGVSQGPFESLNLGNPSAAESIARDSAENIKENFRRLQEAIGAAAFPRAWVYQVHGNHIELLESEGEGEYAETLDAELRDRFSGQRQADGLVSSVPGVLLTIRVADCVPVLLSSAGGAVVAAVHAGWRGVVSGVLPWAIRAMGEVDPQNAGANQLLAAIGPAICGRCFEVGPEVADEFRCAGLAAAVTETPGTKPHVDLIHALRQQLGIAGVTRVDATDTCTFENAADFFSHRRDRGLTGRMAAVIAAGTAAPKTNRADRPLAP